MCKFLDDVGMKEASHDRHGSNAPATYIEGQIPIEIPPLMRFQGRRVKSKHPRIAHWFDHMYKHFAIKHGLAHKIYQLEAEVEFPITQEQKLKAEEIAKLRSDGIQYADKQCRRLF